MAKRPVKPIRNRDTAALQQTLNQRDRELGVLLEDVNSKFDTIAEGYQGLNRQFSEFRDETRQSFAEIRSELRWIRGEIESLRRTLTQKADLNRLEELERRVQILEHGLARSTNKK